MIANSFCLWFPSYWQQRCAAGRWRCTRHGARSAPNIYFLIRKNLDSSLWLCKLFFYWEICVASLGGLFSIFHLEDSTFVFAAGLVWAKQTGWIEQTGALLWLTDECVLLFGMKKHNSVCVIVSLHVCAFLSSRASDLALLRLHKLRLKRDLGFCREIISR